MYIFLPFVLECIYAFVKVYFIFKKLYSKMGMSHNLCKLRIYGKTFGIFPWILKYLVQIFIMNLYCKMGMSYNFEIWLRIHGNIFNRKTKNKKSSNFSTSLILYLKQHRFLFWSLLWSFEKKDYPYKANAFSLLYNLRKYFNEMWHTMSLSQCRMVL